MMLRFDSIDQWWRPMLSMSARLLLKLRMMRRDMMWSNVIILQVINYRLTGIIRNGARERSHGDTSDVLVELVIKARVCIFIVNNGPCTFTSSIVIERVHTCRRENHWENKIHLLISHEFTLYFVELILILFTFIYF